ncbi:Tyrosine--tRNA ligase [Mycena kentingensis (nom. inval.)]|nr:Tyrosine--tRNA ligase [Mycena kentingensis (nom. inval.)]
MSRLASSTRRLLDTLTHRGFVHDITAPDHLNAALQSRPHAVYLGIDPTAPALHVGHLLPLMCLLHFHIRGHRIIPLIGGATGLIGDPSGRATEREPAEEQTTLRNTNSLVGHVQTFFTRAMEYAKERVSLHHDRFAPVEVMNNVDWHRGMTMMHFLRTVGHQSRVNTMLNKESVRTRLESKHGISFTEFTYQLLQAYDFYHLNTEFGCTVQLGGSDQWGNILGGISLINRMKGIETSSDAAPAAFGLTTPLLTTASGAKFGKSAGNAVWMDPQLTSVFNFYQYFVKCTDADVEKYMKLLTLMSIEDIDATMEKHRASPDLRIAQRRLASELTELVHLKSGRLRAETMTKIMFESDLGNVKASDVLAAFADNGSVHYLASDELLTVPVTKLAAKYGLAPSTSAARTLVQSRGLYLNNQPVSEVSATIKSENLIDNEMVVLKAGKDKLVVLTIIRS